jgi:hypothetical protein
MSGGYGYPGFGAQRQPVAVSRLVAAALLVVGAALAVGGSFGAFSVFHFESDFTQTTTTTTTTGWGVFEEPQSEPPAASSVLDGVPIIIAATSGLVAALLLVLTARRPGDQVPGRLAGVGAAGLLVGVVAVIWLDLISSRRNVAAATEAAATDSDFRTSFQIGVGGYLILVAALAALVAAVLLLVPRRPGSAAPVGVPPGAGPFPAFGAGPQAPWPATPSPWSRPGPDAPPPGWGPPPAPPPHQG